MTCLLTDGAGAGRTAWQRSARLAAAAMLQPDPRTLSPGIRAFVQPLVHTEPGLAYDSL